MPQGSKCQAPIIKGDLFVKSAIVVSAFVLGIASSVWGQTTTASQVVSTKHPQWHKYVNREYQFSFWYPETYKPSDLDGLCKGNDYRRFLICLAPTHDSDSSIMVSIILGQPFHVYPNHGDVMPTRQKMGHHIFYCGLAGSQAVGLSDQCVFDLKGRTLEFTFDPAQMVNWGYIANPLVSQMLATFRVLKAIGPQVSPTLDGPAPHTWRTYINKEFGFLLSYSDTYRPTSAGDVCPEDNKYRRWLLCLEGRYNPDATIKVTIVVARPFYLEPDAGGFSPSKRTIGRHTFFCGTGGSMGTGFSDECIFDLKGKLLEFSFSPALQPGPDQRTNPILIQTLNTFRTF